MDLQLHLQEPGRWSLLVTTRLPLGEIHRYAIGANLRTGQKGSLLVEPVEEACSTNADISFKLLAYTFFRTRDRRALTLLTLSNPDGPGFIEGPHEGHHPSEAINVFPVVDEIVGEPVDYLLVSDSYLPHQGGLAVWAPSQSETLRPVAPIE